MCGEHCGGSSAPYSNQNCVNGVESRVESSSDCLVSGVMDQAEEEVYKR